MSDDVKLLLGAIPSPGAGIGLFPAPRRHRDRSRDCGGGPMITREPIYAALFALVAGGGQFRHGGTALAPLERSRPRPSSRRCSCCQKSETRNGADARRADGVDAGRRALCVCACERPVCGAGDGAQSAGRWHRGGARTIAGSPGIQDLGLPAMVQHAYIAGKIETDDGVLRDQAVAIIPVEILCL